MHHKYECVQHKWPEPGSTGLEWRCPGCATGGVPKAKVRTKSRATANASGNAHLRLSGRTLQTRNLKVKEAASYCCAKCGIATTAGEVDHVKALENGGSDHMDNLQYLCVECHKVKTRQDLGHKVKRVFGPDGYPIDGSW